MKNIYKFLSVVLIAITLISCEEKVDIPLDTTSPKLVIEANILWQKGTSGTNQTIKLTTTTDYYTNIIPTVSGATVYIQDLSSPLAVVFAFNEIPNSGNYVCNSFVPAINHDYLLTVIYNGQTYKSTEKLLATPTIDSVQQNTVQGFGGDEIQVKFFYQDNGAENNNYLVSAKNASLLLPEYGVIKDEFFQGNQMFGFYTNEDLKSGDQLTFGLQGISTKYYNYLNKLLNIAGSSNGSPFATPPATLRGNIVNQTDENNYPLGYFHLSEVDTKNYTVQ